MTYTYTINQVPKSNNVYAGRRNVWSYRQDKKDWKELVKCSCVKPKPKKALEKAQVYITYHFTDNRRRDPDNYAGKFILDGLTEAEIIADDSFQTIQLILNADFNQKEAKTLIEITDL